MSYTDASEILHETAGTYYANTPQLCVSLLPVSEDELRWTREVAGQRFGVAVQELQPYQLVDAYASWATQLAEAEGRSQRDAAADRLAARQAARRVMRDAGSVAIRFVVTPANGHDAQANSASFQVAMAAQFPEHIRTFVRLYCGPLTADSAGQ